MLYVEFLAQLHQRLRPRTYLEIGIRNGHSLSVSRCHSLGIDPDFHVTEEILAPSILVRSTSDEYFSTLSEQRGSPFRDLPVDLAFIDGMHHFEHALRDFVNIEKHSRPSSVIVFDDVLPRSVDEAARDRHTQDWTGDIFRIPFVLRARRPDLRQLLVDTEPTGLLLVLNLDPKNTALSAEFAEIVETSVRPDPQMIPREVLIKQGVLKAEEALSLTIWDELRSARENDSKLNPHGTGASQRSRFSRFRRVPPDSTS